MIFNIFLDDIGMIDFDDFLQRRIIFVIFMDGEDIGIRRIFVFPQESIRYGVQTGIHGIVGIDSGEVNVVERTGNLSGFQFFNPAF